jgi:hypothetical protein
MAVPLNLLPAGALQQMKQLFTAAPPGATELAEMDVLGILADHSSLTSKAVHYWWQCATACLQMVTDDHNLLEALGLTLEQSESSMREAALGYLEDPEEANTAHLQVVERAAGKV